MAFHRSFDGSEPVGPDPATRAAPVHEEHRLARSGHVATGTLACPRCDVPVALDAPAAPADPLDCPFCGHAGALREFLSLAAPSRPARVVVRVRHALR
jgi:hypothetical protein